MIAQIDVALRIVGLAILTLAADGWSGPAAANCAATPFEAEAAWGPGTDASPAFMRDGKTVFFTRGEGEKRRIFLSRLNRGAWSAPEPASFSGKGWMDIEPAMSPDGSYLVFVSNRPASGDGPPIDGSFGGRARPHRGGNLWRVDRHGGAWSEPIRLPDLVNQTSNIFAPAVARDGSIYFMRPDDQTGKFRLYVATLRRGRFQKPEPLPFSDGTVTDNDPAVSPDQSLMVFASTRPPTAPHHVDLFFVVRRNGAWGTPRHTDVGGDEARLSPDLKTIYFNPDSPDSAANRIWRAPAPWRHPCVSAKS